MRRLLPLLLAGVVLAAPGSPAAGATLPPAHHVFVIVLENHEFFDTFGPSGQAFAPYLNRTLVPHGQLLTQYYGVGHSSADNYIAMAGGQPPTPSGQDDCPDDPSNGASDPYAGTHTPKRVPRDARSPYNVAAGDGCLYPDNFLTIGDQLTGKGYTWKSYNQDMPSPCYRLGSFNAGHPGDYRRKHNPFVLFDSLIESGQCERNVVGLPSPGDLAKTLSSEQTAPNFTYLVPNQCDDGHDSCARPVPGVGLDPVTGSEVALSQIDAFLQRYVPPIVDSPVFKRDGLLVITFDEAVENLSCCNEQPGPATADPGNQAGIPGSGGGDSGAVLISPFIKPGADDPVHQYNSNGYNHYSLLRSVEDLFGLSHLGYAAASGLVPFGADVFTNAPAPAAGGGTGGTGGQNSGSAGAGTAEPEQAATPAPQDSAASASARVSCTPRAFATLRAPRLGRSRLVLRGRSTSVGCGRATAVGVTQVALARRVGARCRFVHADGRLAKPTSCAGPRWLLAARVAATGWRLTLPRRPPAGRYLLLARVVPPGGPPTVPVRRGLRLPV